MNEAERRGRQAILKQRIQHEPLHLPLSTPITEIPDRLIEAVWPAIDRYIDDLEAEYRELSMKLLARED